MICIKCKEDKEESLFRVGLICKKCVYDRQREILLNKLEDPEIKDLLGKKRRVNGKRYRERNKEKISKGKKIFYLANREKINKKSSEYRSKNKGKIADGKLRYMKNRYKVDKLYALTLLVRNMVRSSFRYSGYTKKSRTHEILGCSFVEFKKYLESKFEHWMTWENRGLYNGELNYGWDIDHITPLSSIKTEEDLIKLNHYTNLQPLCSKFNRHIKSDNIL